MLALESIESQYIEAMKKFINSCELFKFTHLRFINYRNGLFQFHAQTQESKEAVILKLDPYSLEIYGSFWESNIGFYLGQLEYGVHY
ncbi:hypothetical protein [Heyndrickxia sporothermodurans]|uniref:hypothetical protein n=1 Tax=Heyndrickxia sporothermodurans TaxID=46224 RepID=UPI00192C172B|nr:hypothetical protein [Heyndrickxia sporothermodurans]MBL5769015.1 hypothetical protein [Heyndrickxia sporothermodurans]MBL5772802.1 hypothetical protein [Heyndrickxia sporothermodurans]MBL5783368.1 hypothetical protein [Heyndrickxia sporothermodurans]MBL5786890.1 hypothetical protein [Heyndrickxia sporothermodurans]MBL5790507.1 hypothetical protein [Heyndrickxia sporothermodurans]